MSNKNAPALLDGREWREFPKQQENNQEKRG